MPAQPPSEDDPTPDPPERSGSAHGLHPDPAGEPPFVEVAAEHEIAEGTMKGLDVEGERVLLARVDGRLYAIGGLCTHQIAYLEDGGLCGRAVSCPRHGATFDLATGEALSPPADLPVEVYEVRVTDGRIGLRIRARLCPGS